MQIKQYLVIKNQRYIENTLNSVYVGYFSKSANLFKDVDNTKLIMSTITELDIDKAYL